MKDKREVAILLSTYNGECYLYEQICSILKQNIESNYVVKIYIRDDGSSDNTLLIINDLVSNHKNINLIHDGLKLGARLSFAKLLMDVNADYYFFCDQDDIWNDDKLYISLNNIINSDNIPTLFFTDLNLVDEHGNSLGMSFWQHQRINTCLFSNPNNFIYNSLVTGCTIAINKKLRDEFISLNIPWYDIFYHDQMLSILAAKIGSIKYSPSCTIDYRQHSNNVVGSNGFSFINKTKIAFFYASRIKSLHIILKFYNISIFRFIFCKLFLMLKRIV
ncbi:TPA: glycosyltransferase family 2 protein [Vibrio cholerae]|nr:glycosyltransferase family 2 protein [Vibrio cholerae]